jgi:Arc/MetJ family transcription regulator
MRTNIDIDDGLMAAALEAGPYKTKKEAVEAGLKLLARQAAYREVLKWRGKLRWEGDERIDWAAPTRAPGRLVVREPAPGKRRAGR